MSKIFISYRRDDAAGHAGRIFDHLVARFGEDNVFRDVDTIEPGTNFVEALDHALDACAAAVVVIGRQWLDARNDKGDRRLDDPADWVRLEIATVLRRGTPVIPALVEGALMPSGAALPGELAGLAEQQAIEISDSRWDYDIGRLIEAIERAAGLAPKRDRRRLRIAGRLAAAALIGIVCAMLFAHFVFYPPDLPPDYVYALIFLMFAGLAYFAIGSVWHRWRRA